MEKINLFTFIAVGLGLIGALIALSHIRRKEEIPLNSKILISIGISMLSISVIFNGAFGGAPTLHGQASITIIEAPPAAKGIAERNQGQIGGNAQGCPECLVAIYSYGSKGAWRFQNYNQLATIDSNGRWHGDVYYGVQYAALLVEPYYNPLQEMPALPNVSANVIAIAVVKGFEVQKYPLR
jgi:hypothetical protein